MCETFEDGTETLGRRVNEELIPALMADQRVIAAAAALLTRVLGLFPAADGCLAAGDTLEEEIATWLGTYEEGTGDACPDA